ncbi:MAG: hypothetical protein LBM98_05820 [Oscillospiraceae bacterium]|nr:hypothetical protein [Oscillospiraceae bacterium]
MLRRISLTTYRKCGGGFAKTVRRRAHHGQGEALPCPGALRRDGGRWTRPRTARVWTWVLGLDCFARLAMTGKGGFETRPYVTPVRAATPVQTPVIINYQLSIVNCPNPRL